jgi:predicted DNA binding CopG/RHH family protein
MKKELKLRQSKSEDQERDFWSKIDLSEYFGAEDFKHVYFPNLKPTIKSISIRLPEFIINRIKEKANKLDVSYQSLLKRYVVEGMMAR